MLKMKNGNLTALITLAISFCISAGNTKIALAAENTNPVDYFGEMQVSGNKINGSNTGESMQVKGMSFFWSNWTTYYNTETVDRMVDEFQVEILRASYGVDDNGTPYDNDEDKIRTVVEAAIDRGVYIIIDWHSHGAHNNVDAAKDFFSRMAQDYGSFDNVIFEVYNEPTYVTWSTVKEYAEEIISEIRKYSNNLVVVGSPTWSQDVGSAADDRINDDNVAYSLHFYAGTHFSSLRDKADYALSQGVPLFVTEWGSVNADGNGSINYDSTNEWLEWMDENQISWANWTINDKAESSSIFYSDGSLTEAGNLLKGIFEDSVPGRAWININNDTVNTDEGSDDSNSSDNSNTDDGETGSENDDTGNTDSGNSDNDNSSADSTSAVVFSKTSDWGNGFNGKLTINNSVSSDIEDWVLEFDFDGQINSFWTAEIISHSGNHYIVKPLSWNSTIAPGESIELGFTAKGGQEVTNIILNDNSTSVDEPDETDNNNSDSKNEDADYKVEISTIKDWGTGFNGQFQINNTGSDNIQDWVLEFDFEGQINSFWTAQIISHSGNHYIIKPLSWNSTIQSGQSLELGFTAIGNQSITNITLK
ncbi:hypothetical protein BTJ40_12585 [Microbulbifer sp. A4B17]|uniref:cellulase family glycosylhydrolase n=1 Tax=Microbulbifer sp. A4B17 TaxID=359370 RepID=UPI000D52CBBD|nr:cellulase family glycosylhydrolase [Microbulbifer sp. A4B17]AWF81594.1 hypothetical protein BTJ40_12585 [Microbulbifer sp. A4B17]